MRKWLFALSVVIAFYLDTMFFNVLNIYGIRPDVTLAAVICFGFLLGSGPAAVTGFAMGLLADVLFNKIVGLTPIAYMVSGYIAGLFYRKFYADNLIIPTVLCVICFFVKEHFFLIASVLTGARPGYFLSLAAYILPSMLLTGGVCAAVYLFFKKALFKPLWRNKKIDLDRT